MSTESQFSAQDKVCSLVENDDGITNGKTVEYDASHTSLDKEHNHLEKIALSEMQFILDIDLDFFSTQNPFHLIFSDFQFHTLHELYKWKRPKWNNANEVKDAAKERQEQLDMLKHILIEEFEGNHCTTASSSRPENCYHYLDNKDKITAKRRELVHSLVEDLKKTANPDIPLNWKFLHDAGCTFDWSGLPHHVSEIREIENLVEKSERLLRSLPKPALVTIARSSYDEYCPKDKVDVIQKLVLVMLERLYGPIDTILDYEPEEEVSSEVNLAGSSSQISYVKKATCENLK